LWQLWLAHLRFVDPLDLGEMETEGADLDGSLEPH
jgi:hypothetical protein